MARLRKKAVSMKVIELILAVLIMLAIIGLVFKFVPSLKDNLFSILGISKIKDYQEKIEEQLGYDQEKAAETYKEFKEKYPDESLALREEDYVDLIKALADKSAKDMETAEEYVELHINALEEFEEKYPESAYIEEVKRHEGIMG